MKICNLILLIFILNVNVFCQKNSEDSFVISGKISGIGNSKVLLGNLPHGITRAFKIIYYDSCFSINDSFIFKGHVTEPGFYSIDVPGITDSWFSFIAENSIIKIYGKKDSLWNSSIFGSKQEDKYEEYQNDIYSPWVTKSHKTWNKIDSLDKSTDSVKINRLYDSLRKYHTDLFNSTLKYAIKNPDAFVSLYRLESFFKPDVKDTLKYYFQLLSDELKNSSLGKKFYYELYQLDSTVVMNEPVPDFSSHDTSGNVFKISDHLNHYILLDFWASWCGPCLEELPEVKKIFKAYAPKGLEIVSISLDTDEEAWKKAIIDNEMNWYHLSDLKGGENKDALTYGIKSIPRKYLLGPEGILILKDVSLEEIEKKLKEIFMTK